MFLALVGEKPRPTRASKNLLVGGTGRVRLHNKSAQRLEIPMAVSDARKRFELMRSRRTDALSAVSDTCDSARAFGKQVNQLRSA